MLLAKEWHYIWGISDRIWFILQEYEPHSDAIHEFFEVYRRPESLINRIVFELAYANCSHYGPNLAMLPGADRGATSVPIWVIGVLPSVSCQVHCNRKQADTCQVSLEPACEKATHQVI